MIMLNCMHTEGQPELPLRSLTLLFGEGPGPGGADAGGADVEILLGAADGGLGEADLAGAGKGGGGGDRAISEDGPQVVGGVVPLRGGQPGIGGLLVDALRD